VNRSDGDASGEQPTDATESHGLNRLSLRLHYLVHVLKYILLHVLVLEQLENNTVF